MKSNIFNLDLAKGAAKGLVLAYLFDQDCVTRCGGVPGSMASASTEYVNVQVKSYKNKNSLMIVAPKNDNVICIW